MTRVALYAGRKPHARGWLRPEDVLAIFRRAHTHGGDSYARIGRDYGVSAQSVGSIARGQSYSGLFKRVVSDREFGVYYISELRDGAPLYRMDMARRVRRGVTRGW